MKKWVYLFTEGSDYPQGIGGVEEAGLLEMARIGIPVPLGFTISSETSGAHFQGGTIPRGMWPQILGALEWIERQTGKVFGDPLRPLLISVWFSASLSAGGAELNTIPYIGLNDKTVRGLARLTGDPCFAYDCYFRFIQMLGLVQSLEVSRIQVAIDKIRAFQRQGTFPTVKALRDVVIGLKDIYRQRTNRPFPQNPREQLRTAVAASLRLGCRNQIPASLSSSEVTCGKSSTVNVVTSVFGNLGARSGVGVVYTRNPLTGQKTLYGEYSQNTYHEDVIANTSPPQEVAGLVKYMPEVYRQLQDVAGLLEFYYRDMQEIWFTVEQEQLWILRARRGKRTANAAVRIAVDMAQDGLITREEAIARITPAQLGQLMHPHVAPGARERARLDSSLLAKGLNASPGVAYGQVTFDVNKAEVWGQVGKNVILVRPEILPTDVHGMLLIRGILTKRGGATSHAAVVARGLGLPCVSCCEAIQINEKERFFQVGDRVVREGEIISIDGSTGEVFAGTVDIVVPSLDEHVYLRTVLDWADDICVRKGEAREHFPHGLQVWANADCPEDAERARSLGAKGIGLCRTEHMFLQEGRLPIVQRMILADTEEERQTHLDQLLSLQRSDFEGIFRGMNGLPVIIRLLDPPLNEFLPNYEDLLLQVAEMSFHGDCSTELNEKKRVLEAVGRIREANPMLGFRGIRVGIILPAITRMQARAIFEGACNVAREGILVRPGIMVPLTCHANELGLVRAMVDSVANKVMSDQGIQVRYKFGTMIEVPRAALTAGQLAEHVDFFSFGTNDLTQTVFGCSRDDAEGRFLLQYIQQGILPENPFQVLDQDGVGSLIKAAVQQGRVIRPHLEIGICGEHGGDPASIRFCYHIGLDYISCSPSRLLTARLAAAHAALNTSYAE